jgi:hypothetical protein
LDFILRFLGVQLQISLGKVEEEAEESYALTTSDHSFGFGLPPEYFFTDDEE